MADYREESVSREWMRRLLDQTEQFVAAIAGAAERMQTQ